MSLQTRSLKDAIIAIIEFGIYFDTRRIVTKRIVCVTSALWPLFANGVFFELFCR